MAPDALAGWLTAMLLVFTAVVACFFRTSAKTVGNYVAELDEPVKSSICDRRQGCPMKEMVLVPTTKGEWLCQRKGRISTRTPPKSRGGGSGNQIKAGAAGHSGPTFRDSCTDQSSASQSRTAIGRSRHRSSPLESMPAAVFGEPLEINSRFGIRKWWRRRQRRRMGAW